MIAMAVMGTFGGVVLAISWREFRLRRVDAAEDVTERSACGLSVPSPRFPQRARRRQSRAAVWTRPRKPAGNTS